MFYRCIGSVLRAGVGVFSDVLVRAFFFSAPTRCVRDCHPCQFPSSALHSCFTAIELFMWQQKKGGGGGVGAVYIRNLYCVRLDNTRCIKKEKEQRTKGCCDFGGLRACDRELYLFIYAGSFGILSMCIVCECALHIDCSCRECRVQVGYLRTHTVWPSF